MHATRPQDIHPREHNGHFIVREQGSPQEGCRDGLLARRVGGLPRWLAGEPPLAGHQFAHEGGMSNILMRLGEAHVKSIFGGA